jgi:Fe-S-cluster-containing dehydrogenase component
MMKRRQFLRGLLGAGAAATAAGAVTAAPAQAAPKRNKDAHPEHVGMLFDSTKCIGCKACVVACREANGLKPEGTLHDNQTELNGNTKNVIKMYRDEAKPEVVAFMKQQCMHCVDPGCVSACMLGSFKKREGGRVTWDQSKCVGCRYCQVACPFGIPAFEWEKNNPKIVKCELCNVRTDRPDAAPGTSKPACTEVCPAKAVIFGKTDDLMKEAKARIAAKPSLYQPKVYGEEEAGGTQVIYLSAVPFESLGLPKLESTSVPYRSENLQHGIYQGMITPVILYGALAATVVRNWRKGRGNDHDTGEDVVDAASKRVEKHTEKKP